jgi:hypothetical protein
MSMRQNADSPAEEARQYVRVESQPEQPRRTDRQPSLPDLPMIRSEVVVASGVDDCKIV